ncbi:uncharacterized protein LOC108627316 isoform X3 [Ceratina calcarata]|uniref:Uncharacterized protein LOC108627316 isoform X3 n=1 Tax=Ceratina calcarata TaxID=156304 RepID=A0AAJ7N9A4_9HYME|nr:uncharacterized protein LOC108627316 isoform X3 [Ceratina calcarata]
MCTMLLSRKKNNYERRTNLFRRTMKSTYGRREISGLCILLFVCRFNSCGGLPVEQPTTFTLNTGNTQPLFNEQVRTAASESRNNVATVVATRSVALNPGEVSLWSTQHPPVTNTHAYARESVRLENEAEQAIAERPISKPFSGFLESFVNPTPLVDGIKEQEKYGNSGDKFIGVGRALVSGYEGLSNFLNAVVDFPRNTFRQKSRELTEALNHVGARLVGLE